MSDRGRRGFIAGVTRRHLLLSATLVLTACTSASPPAACQTQQAARYAALVAMVDLLDGQRDQLLTRADAAMRCADERPESRDEARTVTAALANCAHGPLYCNEGSIWRVELTRAVRRLEALCSSCPRTRTAWSAPAPPVWNTRRRLRRPTR